MSIHAGKYLGRKGASGLSEFIINKMPLHDVFIDCFMGCGVISSKKKFAKYNFGIELDSFLCSELSNSLSDYLIYNSDVFTVLPILLDSFKKFKICVYLDPPYLPCTRTSFNTCKYKYDFTLDQHKQLLTLLNMYTKYDNFYFLLSGYKSDLYMSMLEHWYFFEFKTISRGGVRYEGLWCNFNPDNYIKHTYDFIGDNFTDRQRIKRKLNRYINKFSNLSLDERFYILHNLYNYFFSSYHI